MKNPNEPESKFSHLMGKGFAHLQDGFDQISAWGFNKLKKVDSAPKEDEHEIVKASRKVGGFLGELGSEYYNEYERLKKDRQKKDNETIN